MISLWFLSLFFSERRKKPGRHYLSAKKKKKERSNKEYLAKNLGHRLQWEAYNLSASLFACSLMFTIKTSTLLVLLSLSKDFHSLQSRPSFSHLPALGQMINLPVINSNNRLIISSQQATAGGWCWRCFSGMNTAHFLWPRKWIE